MVEQAEDKKPARAIVGVQFPKDMIAALRDYATQDDRPVGYLIRSAVGMYLDRRRSYEQAEKENEIAALMRVPAAPAPQPENGPATVAAVPFEKPKEVRCIAHGLLGCLACHPVLNGDSK